MHWFLFILYFYTSLSLSLLLYGVAAAARPAVPRGIVVSLLYQYYRTTYYYIEGHILY